MENDVKKVEMKESMALSSLGRVIMLLLHILMGKISLFLQGVKERFPWPAQDQAILPVHEVWMELNLNHFPYDPVHDDPSGHTMLPAKAVLCHCSSEWLFKVVLPLALFKPHLNRSACSI
jgi:hypothetical protein